MAYAIDNATQTTVGEVWRKADTSHSVDVMLARNPSIALGAYKGLGVYHGIGCRLAVAKNAQKEKMAVGADDVQSKWAMCRPLLNV